MIPALYRSDRGEISTFTENKGRITVFRKVNLKYCMLHEFFFESTIGTINRAASKAKNLHAD